MSPEVQPKESFMPIYQCVTSQTLSPELKAAIAKEFTRIHVEFTAAPEPFVNVVFSDLPLGSHYLAGAVRENGTLINAIVRAGRTLETRQALLKSLSAAWSRLTGQPERKLVLRVEEADAATIMEAGLIMPRPGEEAAWMAANKAALGELAQTAA
jgi:phenylpyruvate tautomerase PptA (4-oxalocrotonate tautomerase family)